MSKPRRRMKRRSIKRKPKTNNNNKADNTKQKAKKDNNTTKSKKSKRTETHTNDSKGSESKTRVNIPEKESNATQSITGGSGGVSTEDAQSESADSGIQEKEEPILEEEPIIEEEPSNTVNEPIIEEKPIIEEEEPILEEDSSNTVNEPILEKEVELETPLGQDGDSEEGLLFSSTEGYETDEGVFSVGEISLNDFNVNEGLFNTTDGYESDEGVENVLSEGEISLNDFMMEEESDLFTKEDPVFTHNIESDEAKESPNNEEEDTEFEDVGLTLGELVIHEQQLENEETLDSGDEEDDYDTVNEPILEEESLLENEPIIEEDPLLEEEPLLENEPLEDLLVEPFIEEEPILEDKEESILEDEQLIEDDPILEEKEEPIIEEESNHTVNEPIIEEEPIIEKTGDLLTDMVRGSILEDDNFNDEEDDYDDLETEYEEGTDLEIESGIITDEHKESKSLVNEIEEHTWDALGHEAEDVLPEVDIGDVVEEVTLEAMLEEEETVIKEENILMEDVYQEDDRVNVPETKTKNVVNGLDLELEGSGLPEGYRSKAMQELDRQGSEEDTHNQEVEQNYTTQLGVERDLLDQVNGKLVNIISLREKRRLEKAYKANSDRSKKEIEQRAEKLREQRDREEREEMKARQEYQRMMEDRIKR